MENLKKDYKKYRWFVTSSGKLVIGGKNAEQNDFILNDILFSKCEIIVMHTTEPGSPFSLILSPVKKTTSSDINETAVFTASFSRAWKEKKKKAYVDFFLSSQLYKDKNMRIGTWGVKGEVKRIQAHLELALTTQKGVIRAVPVNSLKEKNKAICKIVPGSQDKSEFIIKTSETLKIKIDKDALLSALPAGGIKIKNE